MEHRKLAGIVLAAFNAILIVICVVLYCTTDRQMPEFSFAAADIVYHDGIEESALLEGVSAYDSVDGDITDRIVVEKTMENRDDDTVVVFYAVNDKAGNVAKASRVFDAMYTGEDEGSMTVASAMESGFNVTLEWDNFMNGDNTEDSFDKAEDASGEEGTQEAEEVSSEEAEEEIAGAPDEETEEETAETPAEEAAAETVETPGEEPTSEPTPAVDSSAPVLALRSSEISVNVGQKPAWVDVIETLRDDKDDYATLFYSLSVSEYDRNKAGTYQVTLSVEDSDGNKSEDVPLTIIVNDSGM